MKYSLSEYLKALASLQESLALYHSVLDKSVEEIAFRDACIKRFEHCIELSWKLSMKLLGSTTQASKPAIREMARNSLIDDPNLWLEFIEARNNTSHTYNEDVAVKVFASILLFADEAQKLSVKLSKIK